MSQFHDSDQMGYRGSRATARQQAAARRRAADRGTSFAQLYDVGDADEVFKELDKVAPLSREERRAEDERFARDYEELAGGATAFRDDEFEGYGSSARYASGVEDDDEDWG